MSTLLLSHFTTFRGYQEQASKQPAAKATFEITADLSSPKTKVFPELLLAINEVTFSLVRKDWMVLFASRSCNGAAWFFSAFFHNSAVRPPNTSFQPLR
jgi:hypothetical protein